MNLLTRVVRKVLFQTGVGPKVARTFWKKVNEDEGLVYLHRKRATVFEGISFHFTDPELNEFLARDTEKWSEQEEFVLKMCDVYVEPGRCIAIKAPNKIVSQSLILDSQYPYILPFLVGKKTAKTIESAVLYDGYGSSNYFHHFLNCLNSIHMMEKADLPKDIPFIINRKSFESKFFQYLYQRSEQFRSINWKIQEKGQWLRVKQLYRFQCIHYARKPWIESLKLYNLKPRKSSRKVFLSRDSKKYSRCLNNEPEVIKLLAPYGFEVVYAEHLTLDQQIQLFQETQYLVALHGAGLVQQLFMDHKQAHIIEIMPKDYLIGLYYWQAHTLRINYYDIIVGSKFDEKRNYGVSLPALEKAVVKMLNRAEEVNFAGRNETKG